MIAYREWVINYARAARVRAKVWDVVVFDAVTEEGTSYTADVTEHAVEEGAPLTDNVRLNPEVINLTGVIAGEDEEAQKEVLKKFWREKKLLRYLGRNILHTVVIQRLDIQENARAVDGFFFNLQLKKVRLAGLETVQVTAPDPEAMAALDPPAGSTPPGTTDPRVDAEADKAATQTRKMQDLGTQQLVSAGEFEGRPVWVLPFYKKKIPFRYRISLPNEPTKRVNGWRIGHDTDMSRGGTMPVILEVTYNLRGDFFSVQVKSRFEPIKRNRTTAWRNRYYTETPVTKVTYGSGIIPGSQVFHWGERPGLRTNLHNVVPLDISGRHRAANWDSMADAGEVAAKVYLYAPFPHP